MSLNIPKDRALTPEELKEVLLIAIQKEPGNIQPDWLCHPENLAQRIELTLEDRQFFRKSNEDKDGHTESFRKSVGEIFHEFILSGIIMHKVGQSSAIFEITQFGAKTLSGESLLLDPDGLIQKYSDLVLGNYNLSTEYYKEAVFAYKNRLFRCSTIALGVASECILLESARAVYEYGVNPNRQGIHKDSKLLDWRIATVTELLLKLLRNNQFVKTLEQDLHANPLPLSEEERDVISEAPNTIGVLADIYRQTRNEQGHPSGLAVDPLLLRAQILAFTRYAQILFEISWIVSGKPGLFSGLSAEFQ